MRWGGNRGRIGQPITACVTRHSCPRLYFSIMSLQGKSAIISGAASGIGRAAALLFAREGSSVLLVDLNQSGGTEVQREISSAGGRAHFEPADVTRAADCQHIVQRAVEL